MSATRPSATAAWLGRGELKRLWWRIQFGYYWLKLWVQIKADRLRERR